MLKTVKHKGTVYHVNGNLAQSMVGGDITFVQNGYPQIAVQIVGPHKKQGSSKNNRTQGKVRPRLALNLRIVLHGEASAVKANRACPQQQPVWQLHQHLS